MLITSNIYLTLSKNSFFSNSSISKYRLPLLVNFDHTHLSLSSAVPLMKSFITSCLAAFSISFLEYLSIFIISPLVNFKTKYISSSEDFSSGGKSSNITGSKLIVSFISYLSLMITRQLPKLYSTLYQLSSIILFTVPSISLSDRFF